MTQSEILDALINELLAERPQESITIPSDANEKWLLYRSLVNIRPPRPISTSFLTMQDEYLQADLAIRGVVDAAELPTIPDHPQIALWQGDITRLKVDAIVNAANSAMLGCFIPCHGCIDNAIHSYAGIQLREECARYMAGRGQDEPTGSATITKAYNLPSHSIIHTVGPIVSGELSEHDSKLLADCYRSCLKCAHENEISSIAFCCISTGEFSFPQDKAAEIALATVEEFLSTHIKKTTVIFNVYKDSDYAIYHRLLTSN